MSLQISYGRVLRKGSLAKCRSRRNRRSVSLDGQTCVTRGGVAYETCEISSRRVSQISTREFPECTKITARYLLDTTLSSRRVVILVVCGNARVFNFNTRLDEIPTAQGRRMRRSACMKTD